MANRRKKILARLKDRQAGFTGLSPNADSRQYDGDVTKPGSQNARKVS